MKLHVMVKPFIPGEPQKKHLAIVGKNGVLTGAACGTRGMTTTGSELDHIPKEGWEYCSRCIRVIQKRWEKGEL